MGKFFRYHYVLLCALFLQAASASAQVKVVSSQDRISVSVDGKFFTALEKGSGAHKPYLWPLMTASGKPITRGFPLQHIPGEPTDHPHQRGIWVGFENLSGSNLWELDPADPHPHMGFIEFRKVIETHDGPGSGGFTIAAQWLDQDKNPRLDETLKVTFYAAPLHSRMFDIDMQLKAVKVTTFEDSRDGVIGLRLGPAFDESNGAAVVNAEGIRGVKQIEGKHSPWVDWQATVDGERVGVVLMDLPLNHRAPTNWITRTNGLLFANPFAQRYYDKSLEDGSLTMQIGDELRLHYRVLIHPGDTDVAAAYKQYASAQ